jgi:hypothetical protein
VRQGTATNGSAQVANGLHRLQPVQTACNLRARRLRQRVRDPGASNGEDPEALRATYMRSRGSIPSMVSPEASTRLVAKHNASRESRTAPEDCNTGHCS